MRSIFVGGHYELMLTREELLRLIEDQQDPLEHFKKRLVDVFKDDYIKYSVMDIRYSSYAKMHSINVFVDKDGQKQIRVWVSLPDFNHWIENGKKLITYLDISPENKRGFKLMGLTVGERDYLLSCLFSGNAAAK